MNKVIALLAVVLLTLLSSAALAENVTVSWEWPTTYCDGEVLPLTDLRAAEIYVSEASIPRVVSNCDPDGPRDVPPAGAIIANVPVSDTSMTIDLQCDTTYYFVIRAQALNGEWSNFSGEASRVLDCARPDVPITVILT